MAQLQAAQANVDAADLKVTAALTAAAAKWAVDPNGKGVTPWLSWYPENAPQYVDALSNYDNVKGVLILLTDEVYGPGVGQLTQDLKVLTNALNNKLPLNPGCVCPFVPISRLTYTDTPPTASPWKPPSTTSPWIPPSPSTSPRRSSSSRSPPTPSRATARRSTRGC